MLFGLAGGAAALAGGGTGLGLWLAGDGGDDPKKADGKPQAGKQQTGPALTDPERPLGTKTTAKPLWTAPVSEPLVQLLREGDTIVALSTKNMWAFDGTGRKKWGPLAHPAELSTGAYGGGLVATVGGGTVYGVMRQGAGGLSQVLRAVRLDTGAEAWTVPLPYGTSNQVSVVGMLDGRVYVDGTASTGGFDPKNPKKGFTIASGPFVWSLDPATRKGWQVILTDPEVKYPQGQLLVPSSGTSLFWASRQTDGSAQKIAALDVRTRKLLWEQPSPGAEAAAGSYDVLLQGRHTPWRDGPYVSAGGLFLHVSDRLHAVDPANGNVVWSSPEVPLKTVVASPDGKTVYAAAMAPTALAIRVYALDARTGAVRWAGSVDTLEQGAAACPCCRARTTPSTSPPAGTCGPWTRRTAGPAGRTGCPPRSAAACCARSGRAAGRCTRWGRRAWWRSARPAGDRPGRPARPLHGQPARQDQRHGGRGRDREDDQGRRVTVQEPGEAGQGEAEDAEQGEGDAERGERAARPGRRGGRDRASKRRKAATRRAASTAAAASRSGT